MRLLKNRARRGFVAAIGSALAMSATLLLGVTPAHAATPQDRNVHPRLTTSSTSQKLAFGTWTWFDVGATGSVTTAYTFYSKTPVLLRVTDALCRGDRFRVLDRGNPLFDTSTVGTDPSCDDQPYVVDGGPAWRDQSYSKGHFLLGPGWHSIKIRITDSPFGVASAFLRIDRRSVS